jgi:hypothetical protein
MTITCICGEVEIDPGQADLGQQNYLDATTTANATNATANAATETEETVLPSTTELPKTLKRVNNSFLCYSCKTEMLRVDGTNLLYKSSRTDKPSFTNCKDIPLTVTIQEKLAFQNHLDNRFAKELKEKQDFYDRKVDKILLEFQNWKKSMTEMVEGVKRSLVVEVEEKTVQQVPVEKHLEKTFQRGDEIFDFDELCQEDDDKDLPSDLPSDNESDFEQPAQSPTNHQPTICGSLPIQITVHRNLPLQDEDKGFEPPHLFAARTFHDTGAIAGSLSARRTSFL